MDLQVNYKTSRYCSSCGRSVAPKRDIPWSIIVLCLLVFVFGNVRGVRLIGLVLAGFFYLMSDEVCSVCNGRLLRGRRLDSG